MCFQKRESCLIFCSICNAPTAGSRYGVVTCLACHVFFRRTVLNGTEFKCHNKLKCSIGFVVHQRDKIGPRLAKSKLSIHPGFKSLFRIQTKQRYQQERYGSYTTTTEKLDSIKIKDKIYHQANQNDIKSVLNMGFQNAIEWIYQLEYLFGEIENRNTVLAESGIGFVLIDQAYKTANESEKENLWILQNNTYLPGDYLNPQMRRKEAEVQFVGELLNTLCIPFRRLRIDSFECVFLKSFLFLSTNPESKNVCILELLKYTKFKYCETGVERFGELILLLGNIRCAIKSFYNHTKVSDLFNVKNFDSYVKNKLFE
uniref:Nuclear receptor domain-containing protein n=1 Tax=Caenorhabditis tropicalis TaxID=1561998 RepID=A0A1I7U9M2_9PELO